MSKVAHYLQEHLVGEVVTSTDARHYFATDGSILQVAPLLIVYPRNENDIRKAARFSWQLAERGRVIPLTARGAGTDQTGAAIGSGMILVFPAHMNRVLELDSKASTVTVEPGINYAKLQQALETHGRFLPPYPASIEYSTVGGAIANNASGEKSVKYGDTLQYVKSLRVVLANGEVIETKRLNKRELSKKLGLATLEGEIYRSIDTLLEEQHDLIQNFKRGTANNNSGLNVLDIKRSDGSFDLTPLFVGSQGTLGIITEAELTTEPFEQNKTLILAQFDSLEYFQQAILELRELAELPSSMEVVDQFTLQQIHELNPNHLTDLVKTPFPPLIMLIEFDGNDRNSKKALKKADKILDKYAIKVDTSTDLEEQYKYRKIREIVNILLAHNDGLLHSLPLFDGAVPPDRVRELLEGLYKLMSTNNLKPAIWGHVGDGNLYLQPRLNLGQVGDRQKAFRLLGEFNKLILDLNGTLSSSSGDGRLKAPYIENMYGSDLYALLKKIKLIFDPHGILNPGVKFGTTVDDLKSIVRSDYSIDHLHTHLPGS